MDLMSGYKGVVGLVFGNENTASNEDSYVERLLNRISNGVLAEDRRTAMLELQSVVAESNSSQLAFGAIGFPVVITVLKEEREDVEMVRGALETLVGALTPISQVKGSKSDVQPSLMNADLLSREVENISLLISLLSEDDFYVRYYTIQILTALLNNSPNRLQEAILTIPRAITRLMDMLMDREVIRNEALLLLTFLTREAEEIQKILVFEGAFDKIFNIIKEEGGSDGGVVVQDCLELLNNLLRNSVSNQILLRETLGFDFLPTILRTRGNAYSFTQQKTTNLLYAMDTVNILLSGGLESDPSRSNNQSTNKTLLVQKKVLDCLLVLGVESRWAPVSVRCAALFCIGNLVMLHTKNREALASKVLGQEPSVEPALNSILRIILRTSSVEEFIASDHIFKCFCEGYSEGQTMLASTLIPQPHMMTHAAVEDDVLMSFGSMLLHGLTMGETNGDLEICSRAASVLSHLLKGNDKCKEKALDIKIEAPTPLEAPEPLLHRMVKYLALASSAKNRDGKAKSTEKSCLEVPILKLLVIWLANSPIAVQCFLDAGPHLTYVLELMTNPSATVYVQGLAAIIVGECVIFNKCVENEKDSFAVVDAITKKSSLTCYFLIIDELMKSSIFSNAKSVDFQNPVIRTAPPNNVESENIEDGRLLSAAIDPEFVAFARTVESNIRESVVDVYSRPKHDVAIMPLELEQRNGENDKAYIARLRLFIDKQCSELQNVVGRNAALAENAANVGGGDGVSDRFQNSAMKRELEEANRKVEALRSEKMKLEMEYVKMEGDLKSLSDAYNSLEEVNYNLEKQVKSQRNSSGVDVEEIRADALRESEAELNDLLVCLGQEQSKVDKLTSRLLELGQDVHQLLEGIGDDSLLPDDDDNHDHHAH